MATPLSVSAHARDLNIQLNDSCNCCCFQWRKRVNPDTQVYVNSYGEVVRFDSKKADDETESLKRCVSNLQHIIARMAEDRARDREEVLREVDARIVKLREDEPQPVTIDMIRRILQVVERPASPVYRAK